MKKTMTIIGTVILVLAMLCTVSCKKEDSPKPVPVTKEEFVETMDAALKETGRQIKEERETEEGGSLADGFLIKTTDNMSLLKGEIFLSPLTGAIAYSTDIPLLGKDTVYYADGKILSVMENMGASREMSPEELLDSLKLSGILDESKEEVLTEKDGKGKNILNKLLGFAAKYGEKAAMLKEGAEEKTGEILDVLYKYVSVVSAEEEDALVYTVSTDSASLKKAAKEIFDVMRDTQAENEEETAEENTGEENTAFEISVYMNKETSFIMKILFSSENGEDRTATELYLGESFGSAEKRYVKTEKNGENVFGITWETTDEGLTVNAETKEKSIRAVFGKDKNLRIVSEKIEGETRTEEFSYTFGFELCKRNIAEEMEKWTR